ncbi:MAG TPA: DUF692 family protein [Agitococcus sp.]|nr:DUF692 family protein [Agitococcus sp.]HNB20049.1 DUF692 family protein [Agitococcus sp.]
MTLAQLPTLGLGISLSLASQPDPVNLVKHPLGASFVEYAGLADVQSVWPQIQRIHQAGAPVLYHPSYINFCGSFANDSAWLQTAAQHIYQVKSAWFAQDCAYCFWQSGASYSTQLGYFLPPILNEVSLQLAIERVQEVQAFMSVPVAIEPPPMTFMVGTMPLMTFFGRLATQTDCAILLDMGHLVSYELASGQRILSQWQDFPAERVIEVHIAGGRIKQTEQGDIYVDAHECAIVEQTWTMLKELLPKLPNLKAVCYECEGVQDEQQILQILAKIRQLIIERSKNPELVAVVQGQPFVQQNQEPTLVLAEDCGEGLNLKTNNFANQERLLFDLVFNDKVRQLFATQPQKLFSNYQLSTQEQADFIGINPHALALDVRVRVDLILSQWCRSLPLTFSLVSSLSNGLALLKELVDSQTMLQAPNDRIVYFVTRLRQQLIAQPQIDLQELSLLVAVLDAELGMASTSRLLKQAVINEQEIATTQSEPFNSQAKITIADYVSASLLPLPYQQLKQALCPCSGAELWRSLNKQPLSAKQRQQLWTQGEAHLFVAKAKVAMVSLCEPHIEHDTAELAEGFANLLSHVDGSMSVDDILQQLQQIGAPASLLTNIQQGFKLLWERGMIRT